MPNFDFSNLTHLLRRSANDPEVRDFFGPSFATLTRDDHYGSVDFRTDGVEAVLKEAPWVVAKSEIENAKDLYLAAFHLHRAGHEGYAGYTGSLKNGVVLDDSETEVMRKLGPPLTAGGGGMSSVLKTKIPRWLKYPLDGAILHLQMDAHNQVELATLLVPDLTVASGARFSDSAPQADRPGDLRETEAS